MINNPVNPSGALYSREDLAEIAAVLSRHPEIWVLADGLYEHIAFDGAPATTLAEIEPRLKPRTLTVSGLAKSYAMMGWRIGYAAGPAALIRAMIAAANADGEITADERQRILAKLDEAGAGPDEKTVVERELASPMSTDALVREVRDPETAEQVYLASALAIEPDTAAERSYLQYLAARLNLDPQRAEQLHKVA